MLEMLWCLCLCLVQTIITPQGQAVSCCFDLPCSFAGLVLCWKCMLNVCTCGVTGAVDKNHRSLLNLLSPIVGLIHCLIHPLVYSFGIWLLHQVSDEITQWCIVCTMYSSIFCVWALQKNRFCCEYRSCESSFSLAPQSACCLHFNFPSLQHWCLLPLGTVSGQVSSRFFRCEHSFSGTKVISVHLYLQLLLELMWPRNHYIM